jgi:hypothetical protein
MLFVELSNCVEPSYVLLTYESSQILCRALKLYVVSHLYRSKMIIMQRALKLSVDL